MSIPHTSTPDMSADERRALLTQLLRKQAQSKITRMPLSYGQQALYFTQQLAPESSAMNIGYATWVRTHVDVKALLNACQVVMDRHDSLRTGFELTESGPVQRVVGSVEPDFVQIDAAGWSDETLRRAVQAAHEQPCDLAAATLMRVRLFTRADAEHVLLVTVHHSVFDGWSAGLAIDELFRVYGAAVGGTPANLPPVTNQYADFVAWQREMLACDDGARLRDYWLARMGGELPVLDLPIDKPRPAVQRMLGSSKTLAIEPALAHELRALARREHTTLYTLFLTAFYLLLHRLTNQEDLIIGSPMAARDHAQFHDTVGYLVSPVPLRAQISAEMTLREALAHVKQTLLEAIAHEDYPFALLIEQLHPKRNPGRTPVIEVTFTHLKLQLFGNLAQTTAGDASTLALELYPLTQENGQFDLGLLLTEIGDTLECSLKYNTDLFEEVSAERFVGHLHTLLHAIVRDMSQPVAAVPLLAPAERELILGRWNATEADYPADRCVHELVAEQAARTPDAVAVRNESGVLSYAELDQRANQVAHHLRALGVRPGVLVGLMIERTPNMLVGLLGVLKAGGAYVPLDPSFPTERLAMMLEDSHAQVLLTQESLADHVDPHGAHIVCIDSDWSQIGALPATPPAPLAKPGDVAYVIFTSGSTGRPKGVQVPHGAVVNFLHSMAQRPGLVADDVLVAVTTLSFDIAVLELMLPLTVGAQIVLATRSQAASGDELAQLLEESGATVMQATPATWRLLLAAEWRTPAGFKALCGGEPLPPALAADMLASGVELWNMYGPTETTIWSTVERITSAEPPILIGRPIANTQLYILNSALQPTPVGVVGELYIGGDGLALGYIGRPDLTAERFVPNPFGATPEAKIYRTGDLARYRPDGAVELLGRTDHQVKIRGFRIELGEIEAVLARQPEIAEAVVVARDDGRGGARLVAYVVPAEDETPSAGALRVALRTVLPDYMLPSTFVPLKALPRTPNNKIDRRALPAPEPAAAREDSNYQPPASATEQAVAEVWRDLLHVERVGVYDNFFDLGGHSLLAVEAIAKLEGQLGIKVGPATMRVQNLGQMAATYDEAAAAPAAASTPGEGQSTAGRFFGAVRRALGPGESR